MNLFHNIRKAAVQLPLPMPNIARVSTMKVLGITFTNSLSVCFGARTNCYQCLCANFIRIKNIACSRHGRHSSTDNISVRNHSKAYIRFHCLVGLSPVLQIDKDLMLSFDKVSVVVLCSRTNCHLPYSRRKIIERLLNQILANK